MTRLPLLLAAGCLVTAGALARPAGSPPVPDLPPPGTSALRLPILVPRPAGSVPVAPEGFVVEPFAGPLDAPRSLLVLPNGDVLVAQARTERMGGMPDELVAMLAERGIFGPSPDRVTLLRETPQGVIALPLLDGLNQPYGLLLHDGWLYVANTDALLRVRYTPGNDQVQGTLETVLALPAQPPNNHWTRNLALATDGRTLLVTVGAATNANEDGSEPPERAAIWAVDPAGGDYRLLATGLRNPVGLDHEPDSGVLWTTVNERDGLGEEVPPDYLTAVVPGADYGWPWVYFGSYPDPVLEQRDPARVAAAAASARVPDLALEAHSVPLGLRFYRGDAFPARWRGGAFVARRGGVGRRELRGYDLLFIPFAGGRPAGPPETFLSGFLADPAAGTIHGRPVDVVETGDGALLLSDDTAGMIWRVRWTGAPTPLGEVSVADTDPAVVALADVELADQFGGSDRLGAWRGQPVAVIVVNVRRLGGIQRWQEEAASAWPDLAWLRIADINEPGEVDLARVAGTLRRRVPPGVPVLMDAQRHWARAFALDTEQPAVLLFAADGRLAGRWQGRWNAGLGAQFAAALDALTDAP